MRELAIIILFSVFLTGCTAYAAETDKPEYWKNANYHVSKFKADSVSNDALLQADDFLNGIWISQFDMHPILRNGNKQRGQAEFEALAETVITNLKRDGFDTVFLQVRPNGDSLYESEIYPASRYIAGTYGGNIEYDAVEIFLNQAYDVGISVHAWINPFRLCYEEELIHYGRGIFYEWYTEGIGKRIERSPDGILYLDPAYTEATEIIVSGVTEILKRYSFDGIHIDDYFYPTEFEFQDDEEFFKSAYVNKGDFRRANIDRTVQALYRATHEFENKIFGVAPAGNIYSLSNGWYVDIYKWCENDGYIDYIMPQLYYGFENATCPFDEVLEDWVSAVKNESIKLYIGLSAAKCALGSKGEPDIYAGTNGKFEWRDNKDILARSLELIQEKANGFCIFSYSSFYDPITGEDNDLTIDEKEAFIEVIKKES